MATHSANLILRRKPTGELVLMANLPIKGMERVQAPADDNSCDMSKFTTLVLCDADVKPLGHDTESNVFVMTERICNHPTRILTSVWTGWTSSFGFVSLLVFLCSFVL